MPLKRLHRFLIFILICALFVGLAPGLAAADAGESPASSRTGMRAADTTIAAPPFKDVKPTHPYHRYIAYLKNGAMISGYEDGTFRPSASVTRAEFVVILANALFADSVYAFAGFSNDSEDGSPVPFADVPEWASAPIKKAVEKGLVEGVSDTMFGSEEPITREQAAAIAWRYMKEWLYAEPYEGEIGVGTENVEAYALEGVRNVIAYGLHGPLSEIYSEAGFEPKRPITRAETSALVYRLLERQSDYSGFALKAYWLSPDGLRFESYSDNWDVPKLKKLSAQLDGNVHGEERRMLDRIVVAEEGEEEALGLFVPGTDRPDGHLAYTVGDLSPGAVIYLFNADRFVTPEDYAITLAHEYGHLFSFYWTIRSEGLPPTSRQTKWAEMRGLRDHPRVIFDDSPEYGNFEDTEHHFWSAHEIMADDYVLLFGSPEAKRKLYDERDDLNVYTGLSYTPDNIAIPAVESTKLRSYWSELIGLKLPPGDIRKPELLDLQTDAGSGSYPSYTVRFAPATSDAERGVQYFLRWSYQKDGKNDKSEYVHYNSPIVNNATTIVFGGSMESVPVETASLRIYAYFPDTAQLIYSDLVWYDFSDPKQPKKTADPFNAGLTVRGTPELAELKSRMLGKWKVEEDLTVELLPDGSFRAEGTVLNDRISFGGNYELFGYRNHPYIKMILSSVDTEKTWPAPGDADPEGGGSDTYLHRQIASSLIGQFGYYRIDQAGDSVLNLQTAVYYNGEFVTNDNKEVWNRLKE